MAAAQWLYHRQHRVAMGRGGAGRCDSLHHCKGEWKNHQRLLRGDFMLAKSEAEVRLAFNARHDRGTEYPVAALMIAEHAHRSRFTRCQADRDSPLAVVLHIRLMESSRQVTVSSILREAFSRTHLRIRVCCSGSVVAGGGLPQFVISLPTRSTLPMLLRRQCAYMEKAFRRMGAFFATFYMKASMQTRKEGLRLMACLPRCGCGRGSFNYRFAQPSRDAQPTSSVFFPLIFSRLLTCRSGSADWRQRRTARSRQQGKRRS